MTGPEVPRTEDSLFERVGGHATFVRLIDEFYRGVASDPPLRALSTKNADGSP